MSKSRLVSFFIVLSGMVLVSFTLLENKIGIKEVFKEDFLVGAAINTRNLENSDARKTLSEHFNSISPENLLKWQLVHPEPNQYFFSQADNYVQSGNEINSFVVGHTLVWHKQTPDWVFENADGGAKGKEELIKEMESHIGVVVGRYKGKIHGWDVVNEAITDDGAYRKSKWFQIAGKDFIKRAFIKAAKVDPSAELYYNDYNMWKPAKIDAALEMVMELKEEGIRVDGVGMQGHFGLEYPTISQIETSIKKISDLGLKVMITELDIDVLPNPTNRQGADIDDNFEYEPKYDPYREKIPEEARQKLAQRYKELFRLFRKHRESISRVTFWGIKDSDSWLNNWPIQGRTAYPLFFENDFSLKEEIEKMLMEIDVK
ncbi:endo-1,4-beta-xylanase [Echinicola jeungdonensis]|uniref:Beta-xylanase n=1 Tax=Echinicola jeungdonensis TaxID=709343 RepID=A0ABV5JB44_9BACT|nr:endo-1,4-beta-xylanase [Echinicola jeungdonensis]MDN3670413.1 endo-1,4-beta-xylanase [Echinicola jeungdonensis]